MFHRMFSLNVCVLVLLLGTNDFFYAQESAVAVMDGNLADTRLENVQLEAQGIDGLLSDLSLSYNIPIGLEIALKDNELATYGIDFKKGTLSELLTQFVSQHDQYAWEIKDGIVNVFPKGNHRSLLIGELLETKVGSFSVKERTSCRTLAESLVATPELKKILEANGLTHRGLNFTGGYFPQLGRKFRLIASNMTLRAILNKVVKDSPTAKFWLITGIGSDRKLLISLSARHEDFPMTDARPGVLQKSIY